MEIHNSVPRSADQASESIHHSIVSEEKLKRIIDEQSHQMLALVDISNAHSNENEILKNKIKQLENDDTLKEMFNFQSLLFILLILILVWISYFK